MKIVLSREEAAELIGEAVAQYTPRGYQLYDVQASKYDTEVELTFKKKDKALAYVASEDSRPVAAPGYTSLTDTVDTI